MRDTVNNKLPRPNASIISGGGIVIVQYVPNSPGSSVNQYDASGIAPQECSALILCVRSMPLVVEALDPVWHSFTVIKQQHIYLLRRPRGITAAVYSVGPRSTQ
jgi:hypothetical protein